MFNPIASGINPKTVVIAVRITGRKRAVPPSIIASVASFLSKVLLLGRLSYTLLLSISSWV
jgi:hypothetical protein